MHFYEQRIGDNTVNSIFLKLNLYKKIELDWKNFITTEEKEYEGDQEYTVGYDVRYSDDIRILLKLIVDEYNIYGKCPCCNKSTAIKVSKNVSLNEKLQNQRIWGYREDAWEEDDFVDMSEYYMKERIEILCSNGGYYNKKFQCPICGNVYQINIKLLFKNNEKLYLIKTGQYPSLRDFNENYTNRFSKDLERHNLHKEYRESLIVHDEGHSIAAYVYMRRIIERIILYKFKEIPNGITEEEFRGKHFNEKIEYLKEYLPEFLKDKKIYDLSSAGIHMLSEEECEEYFPILQQAVELILIDEEKRKKEEELRRSTSINLEKINHNIEKQIKSEH